MAKKAGLSKDAVNYRIMNLEKAKIIQRYITVVNLRKFNYRTHILFFEFRKFDLEAEKKIIDFLTGFPYCIWAASASGSWDIIVDVISNGTEKFDEISSNILDSLGDNLKRYEFLETVKESYYNHKYLTGDKSNGDSSKEISSEPDNTDFMILKELSQNSRIKATEISRNIGISHDRVSYRIKKMLKSKIIEQFTVLLDFSKIGYTYYYLFFKFNSLTKPTEKRIITFLKSRKEVLFFGKNAGKYNFNIDVIVENPLQLKDFINSLRSFTGDIIGSRESLLIFEQHKNDYFPQGIILDRN
ncbi:winged helix-turn-helix transcriptional regulator [Candidatus Woesearchaeota archaeon]|nr:winged helix-turn-helix transcriptional regulator [Candidatus Woesearchaeota archaeon]